MVMDNCLAVLAHLGQEATWGWNHENVYLGGHEQRPDVASGKKLSTRGHEWLVTNGYKRFED